MDIESGAKQLASGIASPEPFFMGRNGTVELQALYFWYTQRRMGAGGPQYPIHLADTLERHAGVFPATTANIDAWAKEYTRALEEMDGTAAGWYKPLAGIETSLLDTFTQEECFRCPLRSLEPYYVPAAIQWTRAVKPGSKVCVVSSFADTISKQLMRYPEGLKGVWPESIFPTDISWSTVRTGYAPSLAQGSAEWPPFVKSWQDAVDYVLAEIYSYKPDLVIVGCGGLGMVIGGVLKRKGIHVIVLGGATQVLFGIKGQRWATHEIISTFWNDTWVWPSADETPAGATAIEGACYWHKA